MTSMDSFLMGVAEISGALLGLFFVGVFFYVSSELHTSGTLGRFDRYTRAGVRIVLVLYAIPLAIPLLLVGLDPLWGRVTFTVLCAVLVAANVDTVRLVSAALGPTRSVALVANEVVSTFAVIVLIVLPWVLGGWAPRPEAFIPSILLALGAGFLSTCALVLALFDYSRASSPAHHPEAS
jgi:hypothetical protein